MCSDGAYNLAQRRAREMNDLRCSIAPPPGGGSHYFKVFRLGDDICAKCGKPRAKHPKRGGT